MLCPQIRHGREERFGLHDHSGAATVGNVIDLAMFIGGVIAEIVKFDPDVTGPDGPPHDAGTERSAGDLGENGNDIYPHQNERADILALFPKARQRGEDGFPPLGLFFGEDDAGFTEVSDATGALDPLHRP